MRAKRAIKPKSASLEAAELAAPAEFVKAGLTEWKVSKEERAAFEEIGGQPVWQDWAKAMTKEKATTAKSCWTPSCVYQEAWRLICLSAFDYPCLVRVGYRNPYSGQAGLHRNS